MSEFFSKAVEYKLAILLGTLFSINALSTAIIASFMNTEWSNLTATSKFLLIVVILQNWTGTLIAFFNQTISRIQKSGSLLPSGDTTVTTK